MPSDGLQLADGLEDLKKCSLWKYDVVVKDKSMNWGLEVRMKIRFC